MSRYTVIYDACVLYPAPLRDALMRLALTGLFKAHWTAQIHDEWTRAAIKNNPGIYPNVLQRTWELLDTHKLDSIIKSASDPLKHLKCTFFSTFSKSLFTSPNV